MLPAYGFIDEPVKATTEPDGSRYIEVHNPLIYHRSPV